ncbi:DDHD domain-containing protein [Daldinia eschscholtzii]|nr:DDHD domain-containing protein [Daldinia eschscholtzii]
MPSTTVNNYFGDLPKVHNRGSKCRLAPISHHPCSSNDDDIPPVNAQYFYASSIPIDEPLSTAPISAAADPKSVRSSLRPFSPADNNAIEKAWLSLASDAYRQNHYNARQNRPPSPALAKANNEKLRSIIRRLAVEHAEKHAREGPSREKVQPFTEALPDPETAELLCCKELLVDVGVALRSSFCAVARRKQQELNRDMVAQTVMTEMNTLQTDSTASVTERRAPPDSGSIPSIHSPVGSVIRSDQANERPNSRPSSIMSQSPTAIPYPSIDRSANVPVPTKPSLVDDGISGRPFVRVGTPETPINSPPASFPRANTFQPSRLSEGMRVEEARPPRPTSIEHPLPSPKPVEAPKVISREVTVGVSRLHEVSLPALQMKPIYWSPVNDIATVLRATWFYRDDMRPIDPTVANQLEAGYRELKPHTETWNDELRCAVEVGPLGEEKVSHPLWPKALGKAPKKVDDLMEPPISSNPFCAARCFNGEAAAEGSLIPSPNEDNSSTVPTHKKFEQYHVIYKDQTTAYLLKPSLKPSAYYGRRPVAKIMRGITVGIPVVRGFDYEAWMRKHKKQDQQYQQMLAGFNNAQENDRDDVCPACKAEEERAQVTDLVLVVHGIGQKLAERVENYHFTHAITAFRRAINTELHSDAVKGALRRGQNSIMVLPVNWRQNLSFEDGGPMKEEDKEHYTPGNFTLKDIEPKTIPAVRSMISDVMFDIPFYMSHHKPKMVAAMVSEANRVYRLWCRNNPGFAEKGRVHLIGHSLGSVMCIEVLSRQPTIPPPLQLTAPLQINHFEFDTKNLFLLGSPVGFFLLLERGALLPRKGRRKPGADPNDIVSKDVVGEAGLFGCIAVDNIYNVMAREDAVAYLLNGTLDPMYAASLKTAYVPSTSTSFLQSVGHAMMSIVPGVGSSTPANGVNAPVPRPPTMRLPSQLELEVHDFTREEIAEKKAFLLNDNGQIDYFLRSGGGPLELQYLNMLSAHTSYWVNQDLIRMLCMEIGRNPGKANTLPAMRAVKATKRVIPSAV